MVQKKKIELHNEAETNTIIEQVKTERICCNRCQKREQE